MVEILKSFIKEQGWKFSEIETNGLFVFGIQGKNGQFQCLAELNDNPKSLIFYSLFGNTIPKDRIKKIAPLVNSLNRKVRFGHFQFDETDGEIRFKTSLLLAGLKPSKQVFENIILPNVIVMDDMLPLFTSFITEEINKVMLENKMMKLINSLKEEE